MSRLQNKPLRWILTATVLFLIHTSAYAQATRTWISGVGDDVNPCSRTAPCKTFAGAISKTAAGGEINTLDPGGFGAVTITKSITLQSDDSKNGGILVVGSPGIVINAGPNDVVVIRGLLLDGLAYNTSQTPGTYGIRFLAGKALHVENSRIMGFSEANSGYGILFAPTTGTSRLFVSDTTITGCGNDTTGGGIYVFPTGGAFAYAELHGVTLANNKGFGIRGDDNSFVTVDNSHIDGNSRNGAVVVSATTAAKLSVSNSQISDNGFDPAVVGAGILSQGALGAARISNDVINNNDNGVKSVSSGAIISYGNNEIFGNDVNGAPTSTLPEL